VVGAAVGAGVVYTTGRDSSEVTVQRDFSATYAACRAELEMQGQVDGESPTAGALRGMVDGSEVGIDLDRPLEGQVHIVVSARYGSGLAPDPDTAERLTHGVLVRLSSTSDTALLVDPRRTRAETPAAPKE